MNNLGMTDDELKNWLIKINELFYDKVFKDEWLGQVFAGVNQSFITSQQVDFMLGALGGPRNYSGRNPDEAHPHIYITEEMWQTRESILKETFKELNAPASIQEKWLKIDQAFKHKIVMKSPSECKPRYAVDEFIIIENPKNKKAA